MRKGHELEAVVSGIIEQSEAIGWHGHKNYPLRAMSGITVKGEPFDFEIFTPTGVHVFDAKECNSPAGRWAIGAILGDSKNGLRLRRQLETLAALEHMNYCSAYFLVWFKKNSDIRTQFICFAPHVVYDVLQQGRKYLTFRDGSMWPFPDICIKAEKEK